MHDVVEIGKDCALGESDAETGLHYNRARYYDQTAGRFLSEDPIGFHGGNNFYAYVENDAADQSDPFGLCAPSPAMKDCIEKYLISRSMA
jgi:RHS repeat-associated protein